MLDLTPENRILRQQTNSLRKDFSELFEQWNYMLTYEESALNALYLNEIGGLQFEAHRLTTELAYLKQKIQLAQACFNRNEQPDWAAINQQLAHQLEEYQRKLQEEAARLAEAKQYLRSGFLNEAEGLQLKLAYRQLVKALHPDLNPDQTDAERDLFLKVQAAYQLCDLPALNEFLLALGGDAPSTATTTSDLTAEVKMLSDKVLALQLKIDQLVAKFPFMYREKLSDETWLSAEKAKLQQQITDLEKEITEKTNYLDLLKTWKPESLH